MIWLYILCSITSPPRKSFHLWDKVEQYDGGRQAAGDSVLRGMRFACWVTKAINTHSQYVILTDFSAATMVPRRRLNITFYVRCLSCWLIRFYIHYYVIFLSDCSHLPTGTVFAFSSFGPSIRIVSCACIIQWSPVEIWTTTQWNQHHSPPPAPAPARAPRPSYKYR